MLFVSHVSFYESRYLGEYIMQDRERQREWDTEKKICNFKHMHESTNNVLHGKWAPPRNDPPAFRDELSSYMQMHCMVGTCLESYRQARGVLMLCKQNTIERERKKKTRDAHCEMSGIAVTANDGRP